MLLLRQAGKIHPGRRFRRPYSTPSPNGSIYISQLTDSYLNLSIEDWLFRHAPQHSPLLLLYRDDPCVVIGRNQNPWKEVNFSYLKERKIPFVRRRSGGGTVYHDHGNTNFSIHLPRTEFDRFATGRVVLRAVRSLGVDANLNERNDICVGKDKISGSAYKIVNKRAYHHGTMLISTELNTLKGLLRVDKPTMVTRGVASVRSPVCKLQQWNPEVTNEAFIAAVIREFRKEYNVVESGPEHILTPSSKLESIDYIQKGMTELQSWNWAYGQTPHFTYTIERGFDWGHVKAEIDSKHGVIQAVTLTSPDISDTVDLQAVGNTFQGSRYGHLPAAAPSIEESQSRPSPDADSKEEQIRAWLTDEMAR